jgi:ABC-type sugar transport system permease subunit
MTTATPTKRKDGSPGGGDSPFVTVLKYAAIALADALSLILIYSLFMSGNPSFAVVAIFALLMANAIAFMPRLYPLRWMAPGLVLVTLLVIYPIIYTVITSATNYGDGHLLPKPQAIDLIENRQYVPEDAKVYEWTLFQNPETSEYALWLTRETDEGELEVAFALPDQPIEDLDRDTADPPETYEGYERQPRAAVVRALSTLQDVVFGTDEDAATIRGPSQAARPLEQKFVYDDELDAMIDQETGDIYYADSEEGFFEREPFLFQFNENTRTLTELNRETTIPPTSGTYNIGEREFRYVPPGELRDVRTGAAYQPGDDGLIEVPSQDRLSPGYRVYIGADNFTQLFTDPALGGPLVQIFIWTVAFALLSVLTTFSLGLFMALILNDAKIPGKKIIRSLLIIPYAIPGVIGILVWQGMLNQNLGIITKSIASVIGITIPWFTDPNWAKLAIILVNLWLGYPYMMLICSGALQAIPSDVYEAAAVDGANPWQSFWSITLPLLLVSVGPLLIASFVFNFNNYLLIEALTAGDPPIPGTPTPAGYTDILISYTYRLAFGSNQGADYGYASAITIIIFVIVAIVTLFQYRFTKTWEEVGENV